MIPCNYSMVFIRIQAKHANVLTFSLPPTSVSALLSAPAAPPARQASDDNTALDGES